MKFIVDAQLPKSLSDFLNDSGHNSIHTLELPAQNKTGDYFIAKKANEENCIVVTKDTDFLESYLLFSKPAKLILVKTGNIKNSELLLLFKTHLPALNTLLQRANFIEINKTEIISHS